MMTKVSLSSFIFKLTTLFLVILPQKLKHILFHFPEFNGDETKVEKTNRVQYYSNLKAFLKIEYFQEYGNEIDNLKDDSLSWFCFDIRTVEEAKKYILSFTPIRGTALDGIQEINLVSGRFLHRSHLLDKLYDMILTRKRIIHIA